jgi:RND family efflux transporter MFP subunit
MGLFLTRRRLTHHDMSYPHSSRLLCFVLCAPLFACGGGKSPAAQGQGGRGGALPATGVKTITVSNKPIEVASELIATVKSLHSTTVQPQADGTVTRVFVKSGDRVSAGSPILQIDPQRQAATVRNAESQRAAREADLHYWTSQVERLRSLLSAGAISQNEFDDAQHNLQTAQANLAALSAQVREGEVQLQYYRVTAPTSGIVGDITIRPGDRVTTDTPITTIDDKAGLEANIQVPLDRAPDLKVGLPVEILDAEGNIVATNPITFVAPRVDDATQTVLAKVALKNMPPSIRVQQFVRTRVIWRTQAGLTIPVVSVLRIGSQYFCFLVESSGQGFIARQRPVQLGEIQENDYVVTSGLKPGDRVIVSGVQKLGDGVPVKPE